MALSESKPGVEYKNSFLSVSILPSIAISRGS